MRAPYASKNGQIVSLLINDADEPPGARRDDETELIAVFQVRHLVPCVRPACLHFCTAHGVQDNDLTRLTARNQLSFPTLEA